MTWSVMSLRVIQRYSPPLLLSQPPLMFTKIRLPERGVSMISTGGMIPSGSSRPCWQAPINVSLLWRDTIPMSCFPITSGPGYPVNSINASFAWMMTPRATMRQELAEYRAIAARASGTTAASPPAPGAPFSENARISVSLIEVVVHVHSKPPSAFPGSSMK